MGIIKNCIILIITFVPWWIIFVECYPQQQNGEKYKTYRRSVNDYSYSNRPYYYSNNNARILTQRASSSVDVNSKFLGFPSSEIPNSKFLGIKNRNENEEKFIHNHHKHHQKKPHRVHKNRRGTHHQSPVSNSNYDPCVASKNQQGRFLWDINIYNVYPTIFQHPSGNVNADAVDCGIENDNVNDEETHQQETHHSRPILSAWNVIYNLIRPGGPLNPRPQRPSNSGGSHGTGIYRPNPDSSNNGSNNEDVYDPVYDDKPVHENTSNDFPTPRPYSPGEIVGSIANTVNGVIQTITGQQITQNRIRSYY